MPEKLKSCENCYHHNICNENRERNHRISQSVCKRYKDKSLIVELPCKVGDEVYFIRDEKIIETKVDKVVVKHGGLYLKLACNSVYETTCNSIGKTVFLTREEAEKALREREKNG